MQKILTGLRVFVPLVSTRSLLPPCQIPAREQVSVVDSRTRPDVRRPLVSSLSGLLSSSSETVRMKILQATLKAKIKWAVASTGMASTSPSFFWNVLSYLQEELPFSELTLSDLKTSTFYPQTFIQTLFFVRTLAKQKITHQLRLKYKLTSSYRT